MTGTPPSSHSTPDERTATSTSTESNERGRAISRPEATIGRRSYLKLLTVSTVPFAAGRAQAAEAGYGSGGYGEGGYGGTEEDGNDEPVAPSVVTDSATDVTDSSATLNGTVTDLGDAETVDLRFEHREVGSDTWSATEEQQVTAETSYSETVENLASETEYEYRVLASSDVGTAMGETRSFVTDAVELGDPVIESLQVADTSGPNPHVDLEVEWSVSHPDDALEEVRIVIRNDNDRLIDGATVAVDGSSASGSEAFRIHHGAGETYVVTLTVSDRVGNVTREDTTIST